MQCYRIYHAVGSGVQPKEQPNMGVRRYSRDAAARRMRDDLQTFGQEGDGSNKRAA
jgi:hypothetical protein